MKRIPVLLAFLLALALRVSAAETQTAAWRTLFDGKDTSAWRAYDGKEFSKTGWVVEDGCLHLKRGGKGDELVTVEAFDNFEFEWEWKLATRANNGIKYLVSDTHTTTPGPEYQMVDDATMADPKHQTASFYDVLPPQVPTKVKPPGEWNQSRLVIQGRHVEHWLNGVKVLAFELGGAEVKAALAKSKFKDSPGYGDKIKGHLLLTDHHSEAWFRNVRIRDLPAK
ncbi:MAG: DUF1080 domain-containing protein [Pedosphaera sp.]|nr:DUF1080 domain-containing protein [Pedosphaera sp.]